MVSKVTETVQQDQHCLDI